MVVHSGGASERELWLLASIKFYPYNAALDRGFSLIGGKTLQRAMKPAGTRLREPGEEPGRKKNQIFGVFISMI